MGYISEELERAGSTLGLKVERLSADYAAEIRKKLEEHFGLHPGHPGVFK
jgi:hypothetical protein